jgi:hypothetical protein
VLGKLELATPTIALGIVNGPHTQNGVSALNHVAEVPKIEPAVYNKLHQMAEEIVSEMRPNSRIAIFTPAQLIANGVIGVNGSCALKHVEEECKLGLEALWGHKEMEEKVVSVPRSQCKRVTCSLVKFAKIVLGMPHFAQPGDLIAAQVHLSRVVVENLANCVKLKIPTANDKEVDGYKPPKKYIWRW